MEGFGEGEVVEERKDIVFEYVFMCMVGNESMNEYITMKYFKIISECDCDHSYVIYCEIKEDSKSIKTVEDKIKIKIKNGQKNKTMNFRYIHMQIHANPHIHCIPSPPNKTL